MKFKRKTLEDIGSVLEDGLSLISHTLDMYKTIIDDGGSLTTVQERTLTAFITCLYQTNKDYRATQREIEKEVAMLSVEEKKALAGIENDELSAETIRSIINN